MSKHWHAMGTAEALAQANASPAGLLSKEAEQRLKEHGRNILPQEKPHSKLRLFFSQFNSPLMYILLSIVGVSLVLGHFSDAVFIAVILLINTTVGFWQESKANASLAALKKMIVVKARVFRDGLEKEVNAEALVPGDVILVKAGDKIPADARVIASKGLKANEASLTGESLAADKFFDRILPDQTPLSDRLNMVFMGTVAEEGWAKAVVVATGKRTEIGKIVVLMKETSDQATPLQKKILHLSKVSGAFIVSVVGVIAAIGYFRSKSFTDVVVSPLALAVSAIPEGLLPAITVILVLGMRRILKENGLVRRLATTETLGSVTVICTDKTGTLTEGNMQVSHILTTTRELLGSQLRGVAAGGQANGLESHVTALKIAVLANEAFVENPEAALEQWVIRGKPTERALLLAGMHAGLSKADMEARYPLVDRIPFASEHKYAATLRESSSNILSLQVVGAPEAVLAQCGYFDSDGVKKKLGKKYAAQLMERLDSLTDQGLRVVACAHKDYRSSQYQGDMEGMVDQLSLVGFIALKDPLRKDAKSSIETTREAGIRTVIITGDHKNTARAIAQELGLSVSDNQILEGKDLDAMDSEVLKNLAKEIVIFARVSPSHKLQIVEALQAGGEVVAMIGDGVNDAPALKLADIGVAVGSGTDVAKETADLVLLDDNFKTILKAIEQGRVIFGNIRKVLVYLVADDFSEIFLFLVSMLTGMPLPLLPAQILWINLVEDGFPAIALTTEQETKGVMRQKPRDPGEPILHRPLKLWMASIFFITGLAAFLSFVVIYWVTKDLERTRTIIFALMCVDSLVFALVVRSFHQPIWRRDIFSNKYLMGAIGFSFIMLALAIYLPLLQALLGTVPLGLLGWGVALGISFIELMLLEYCKRKFFTTSPF